MQNEAESNEIIVDVTEEEYQADLARGLEEDEVLKPGRHRFKRGEFLARHGLGASQDETVTVRVTIDLELDLLNYFKQRATQSGAESYQEEINKVLRNVMTTEQQTSSDLSPQAQALLADRRFIEAVAERVRSQ